MNSLMNHKFPLTPNEEAVDRKYRVPLDLHQPLVCHELLKPRFYTGETKPLSSLSCVHQSV